MFRISGMSAVIASIEVGDHAIIKDSRMTVKQLLHCSKRQKLSPYQSQSRCIKNTKRSNTINSNINNNNKTSKSNN